MDTVAVVVATKDCLYDAILPFNDVRSSFLEKRSGHSAWRAAPHSVGLLCAGLSKFPKTTLQLGRRDNEDAMLIFLEIRKYGQYCLGGWLSFFPVTGLGLRLILYAALPFDH